MPLTHFLKFGLHVSVTYVWTIDGFTSLHNNNSNEFFERMSWVVNHYNIMQKTIMKQTHTKNNANMSRKMAHYFASPPVLQENTKKLHLVFCIKNLWKWSILYESHNRSSILLAPRLLWRDAAKLSESARILMLYSLWTRVLHGLSYWLVYLFVCLICLSCLP